MIVGTCTICGNTGFTLAGDICKCKTELEIEGYEFDIDANEFVPLSYKGIVFNKNSVSAMMKKNYSEFLEKLIIDVENLKFVGRNLLICSPVKTSKTVMAYTAMNRLSRKGVKTAPILDLVEIRNLILDMYVKTIPGYDVPIELLFSVPYLFAQVPRDLNQTVIDTVESLVGRRVRRGGTTILMYSGDYSRLAQFDKGEVFSSMIGDGSFKTLKVENFYKK